MSKKQTLITSRDSQGRHIVGLFEAALNKAKISGDEAQKLIERGDEFQSRILMAVRELSVSNLFADEEVPSSYGYPSEYRVKDLTPQSNDLRRLFSGAGFFDQDYLKRVNRGEILLPKGAENWFTVPRWDTIAPTYGEAVEKVLATIKSQRPFHNYCEGRLGPRYLQQSKHSEAMWQKLGDEQKNGSILIVPAQFGMRHRGRSVRRSHAVFSGIEFGLGAFATGCMLLTHPERLVSYEDLWIDCAGDKYSYGADGRFDGVPCFRFFGGGVRFGTHWFDSAGGDCGSASGFVPQ